MIVQNQVELPVHYDNIKLEIRFRIDILVENRVLIELKSVEELSKVHFKQVVTYLKLSDISVSILVNFSADNLGSNIKRIVNNYRS